MTLTELKYIIAVARERHFGRAAEACFVSQPTLSVAIRKLEDELNITLFERGNNDVTVTPLGERIVAQAQRVLEQAAVIKEIARQGTDPLAGPLRLGIIYTIAPYLLPRLVQEMIARTPQMPLLLQENFTVRLLELLRQGELDAAIMALPISDQGLEILPLYDEPFVVAVPRHHPLIQQVTIHSKDLKHETMLLLGNGHCFRDNVLEVCPEHARLSQVSDGIQRTFEGSSLETLRHMVASGLGITVLPISSVAPNALQTTAQTRKPTKPGRATQNTKTESLIHYLSFAEPVPTRRVVLVWRKSFTRAAAIEALVAAIKATALPGTLPINV